MKRSVQFIVVHCTSKYPQKKGSYHYKVKRNGEVLQRLGGKHNCEISEITGFPCISIIYEGNAKGGDEHTPTHRQEQALFDKIVQLSEHYREAQIVGAHDLTGEPKPLFDLKTWLANYVPDLELEPDLDFAA
ncbi:MAG: hypothetical protein ACXVPQ_03530 [Bacteroidia bacterium]